MQGPSVGLEQITQAQVGRVAVFLHRALNRKVPVSAWADLMTPAWSDPATDSGFMLVSGDEVVGAYATVKSRRRIGTDIVDICNLAAFCVLEDFRTHSLRLLRAVLGQKGFEFTDLSPSGTVVSLNARLGFTRLDTSTRLVVNLPGPSRAGVEVISSPRRIETVLGEVDRKIYRDHRGAAAARHLVVKTQDGYGYLMFRKDRRKNLPIFASPIYVGGDRNCLARAWPAVSSCLLFEHRLPLTLAERRVFGFDPGWGVELSNPRPKMFRGQRLTPEGVDYLYSEMTLLEW
jgi:hypothetical protein